MNSRPQMVAVVAGMLLGLAVYFHNEEPLAAENVTSAKLAPGTSLAVPLDRDPVFKLDDDAKANVAMHAVYDYCSKFAVFREGSTLEGDYRPREGKRSFANVRVRLAHPEKANGNVLTYQVYFGGGVPKTFYATKTIAAEMCGLPGRDIEVAL